MLALNNQWAILACLLSVTSLSTIGHYHTVQSRSRQLNVWCKAGKRASVWFSASEFSDLVAPVKPQSRCWAKSKCTKVLFLFFIEQIDKTGCQDGPGQLHPHQTQRHFRSPDRLVCYTGHRSVSARNPTQKLDFMVLTDPTDGMTTEQIIWHKHTVTGLLT